MNLFLIIILALTPALFWMWWYYRKDVYDKEPMRLLALVFILATPLSLLSGLLEFTLDGGTQAQFSHNSGLPLAILFYFGVVGLVEEVAKLFVVVTVVYRNNEFNEPMDGIIYAAAAALGFATLENIFYLIDQGLYLILLRGPVSTLGHVLFSGMWGAGLGLAKFEPDKARRRKLIGYGLLLAILTHGAFDVLISLGTFFEDLPWLSLLVIPFLATLYYMVSRRIAYALNISSFNPRNVFERLRESHPAETTPPELRYAHNPNAYRFRPTITENVTPLDLNSQVVEVRHED
ncbi:MAG: PrsW family intramembrane metalloprotease [Chloroflexota bacterium]|nr:PrsW family intramembrane metalloprotease [Chloroflexota bacterium]